MDPRFPPILSQRQIDPRRSAQVLTLPGISTLPYTEWLVAASLFLVLAF